MVKLMHRAAQMASFSSSSPSSSPSTSMVTITPFTHIPRMPALPIVGTLPFYKFGKHNVYHYHLALREAYAKYGPLVAEYRGWRRGTIVHAFTPSDAQTIMAADGSMPHIQPLQDTTQMYRELRQMSPGLGNMNGERWYHLRSAVQQAMMRPQAVAKYLPLVDEVATDFVQHLMRLACRGGGTIEGKEMETVCGKWSLESSGLLAFERRLGALDEEGEDGKAKWAERMIDANDQIFDLSARLKFSLPLHRVAPILPMIRRLVKQEDFFVGESQRLIDETMRQLDDQCSSPSRGFQQFISYLRRQARRGKLLTSDVEVIALSLFSDGLRTTAPTFIYNLYCLATHPDIQAKLYDEICAKCGPSPSTPLSVGQVTSVTLLNQCIKESFRLYPIGTEISRITQKQVVLSGYLIPTGTAVDINTNVLLRDEEYFEDALLYKPQRWSRTVTKKGELHPYTMLPFGHGTRMCAGRRFAEQDLRVALIRLLQRSRVEYKGRRPLTQIWHALLRPENLGQFIFHER